MATSTAKGTARAAAASRSSTRSRVLGFLYVGAGLFIAFAFGGASGDSRFQLNLESVSSIHVPDLVVAVRIEEGTPTVVRLGHLEMPVMSFELFRRIAHDAITTPFLVGDAESVPAAAGAQ